MTEHGCHLTLNIIFPRTTVLEKQDKVRLKRQILVCIILYNLESMVSLLITTHPGLRPLYDSRSDEFSGLVIENFLQLKDQMLDLPCDKNTMSILITSGLNFVGVSAFIYEGKM